MMYAAARRPGVLGKHSRRSGSLPKRRLVEVSAGFSEHVDHEVEADPIDEIDNLGYGEQHADYVHLGRQRSLGGRP